MLHRFFAAVLLLTIGAAPLLAQPGNDADLLHTVGAGDTLISIAHAYGVTLDQLLALNDLDPEALLQIGQGLLVMRAADFAADEAGEASAEALETADSEAAVGGNLASGELPPAPVVEADAPMRDPADTSAQLCFAVFNDENHNGMMEPGEASLQGATIRLLDADNHERLRYTTDGAGEPFCARALERRRYTLEARPPAGFGLTSAAGLRIDLREGGHVRLAFGAKQGLEAAPPPIMPAERAEAAGSESAPPRSLLRELSGLFALGLAAVILLSGMVVSMLLRWR